MSDTTSVDETASAGTPAGGVAPGPREAVRRMRVRALGGDRPYLVGLAATVGIGLVVVSGPIQTMLEQRALVEERASVLAALEAENARLDDRVGDLQRPATIEAEAREEQGMVHPGEVPYVIVPPEPGTQQIAADLSEGEVEERGWFGRTWDALAGFFG